MATTRKIDMTKGSILKAVILFAIPICIGDMLQQLYNTVDTLIIGNFCSSASLAAVGTSAQPVEIFLCIFMGLGAAASILVSQSAGSGDKVRMQNVVNTVVSFLFMCAIPLSVLGVLFGPLVLHIMQVPEDAFDMAASYIRIIFLGTLGNLGYNMNAGILRGLGDSRSTLRFLIISCCVNIVLDLVFVAGFHMDVTGAALATMIAMVTSWVCSILYIRKKYPELEFPMLPKRIEKSVIKDVVSVGLPLGMNSSIYSVGHLLVQAVVNAQGTSFMAAFSIATKLTGLCKFANSSFASAATTFAGQNKGAENYVRLRKGVKQISVAAGIIMFTTGIIGTIFCRPILGIFSDDPEVLFYAVRYIRIVLPWFWTFAVFSVLTKYLNGIGAVKYPTIINLLMLWAVRIPVSYAIDWFYDGTYFMYSMPINYIFGLLCVLAYFPCSKQWKEVCRLAKEKEAEYE